MSRWWCDLCKSCNVSYQTNWFDSRVKWVLADGNQVRLWEDKWACSRTLQEKFSRLYSLSICKDRVISNVGVWVQTECGKILWRHERLM